jgi:cysteinyl-tRNA synthetase
VKRIKTHFYFSGSSLDIHTGDIDHKSPHHDNKIAQSEAYYNKDSCLNYFFHIDHLTINGCKIVKSSKNVVTIFNKHLKNIVQEKFVYYFF